jgi:hypothetical protein
MFKIYGGGGKAAKVCIELGMSNLVSGPRSEEEESWPAAQKVSVVVDKGEKTSEQ